MRFSRFLIIYAWIVITAYADEEEQDPQPKFGILGIFQKHKIPVPGLDIFTNPKLQIPGLDILTKPKVPGTGIQINKKIVAGTPFGGGSFEFGFGIGGQFGAPETGVNLPPAEKPESLKPGTNWEMEDKENFNPRPNWEEVKEPMPESYEDKNQPKPEVYEVDEEDKRPDWGDIGEVDNENRSDDMMEGDLVSDGLIQPRLNNKDRADRIKRFIESKIYHVALKKGFVSNARVSKVKFRRNQNSLHSGM